MHTAVINAVNRIGVGKIIAFIEIADCLRLDFHALGKLRIRLRFRVVGTELCVDQRIDLALRDRGDLHPFVKRIMGHRASSDERAVAALKIHDLTIIVVEQNENLPVIP